MGAEVDFKDIYTTLLIKEGVLIFFENHLDRLAKDVQTLGFQLSEGDEEYIRSTLDGVISLGSEVEYGMRVYLYSPDCLQTHSFPISYSAEDYEQGVIIGCGGEMREDPTTKQTKTAHNEPLEVILGNGTYITECSRSNLFWVKDGAVETPMRGMLEGITRSKILEICKELGLDVRLDNYPLSRLLDADEVFLTGTTKKVLSVATIGEKNIGGSIPGPITKTLMEEFDLLVERYISERNI